MIGILNKGKNTHIINNDFANLDTGIQDEGENTLAKGNKFHDDKIIVEKWYQKWWLKYILFPVITGLIIWSFTKLFN